MSNVPPKREPPPIPKRMDRKSRSAQPIRNKGDKQKLSGSVRVTRPPGGYLSSRFQGLLPPQSVSPAPFPLRAAPPPPLPTESVPELPPPIYEGCEDGDMKRIEVHVYCLDVSTSMWLSSSRLRVFGKSRLEVSKEMILRSPPSIEEDDPTERYAAFVKFDREPVEVVPIEQFSTAYDKIAGVLEELHHGRGTALFSAIQLCETMIHNFLSDLAEHNLVEKDIEDKEQRSLELKREYNKIAANCIVFMHVFTDGMDNQSDNYRTKQFSEYKFSPKGHNIYLYSFSSDFYKSQEMAKQIGAKGLVMVDTNRVDEAIEERDKAIFSVLSKRQKKKLEKKMQKAKEVPKYDQMVGFNLVTGDTPDLNLTANFLRKVDVVFQSEEFLKEEGIFRISGSKNETDLLESAFLKGESYLDNLSDPHQVATATKNALKKSHPVLSTSVREQLNEAICIVDEEERLKAIREILNTMSPRNKECLQIILRILQRVCQFQEFNQMGAPNLAITFTPIIFKNIGVVSKPNSKAEYDTMTYFIENGSKLL